MDHRVITILFGSIMILSGSGLAIFADASEEDIDIEDAEVSISPNPMNFISEGKFVTVHIEVPATYDIKDIKVKSIMMDGSLQPEEPKGKTLKIGDHDNDDIPDIMLKFDRQAIIDHYGVCENKEVSFTGSIDDLTFEGKTKITIFDNRMQKKSSALLYSTDFSSDPEL